jgi:formylglycine-generating enzyme required for sulfatase activity
MRAFVILPTMMAGLLTFSTPAEQAKEPPREVKNSVGMKLRHIPAGKFTMGSPTDEKHRHTDETQHEVTISKAFYLCVYEVTQGQYEKIMGANPSHFSANGGGKQQVEGRDTSDYPVERVTWQNAALFCKKLSSQEEKTYRLPTEAEWEYACRAGTTTVFNSGNDFHSRLANINGLMYAAYGKEIPGPFYRRTVSGGEYKRNDFGLADMHGNVQEWCADWYAEDYYKNSPKNDPPGPKDGKERVLRGGAWPSSAKACRSAARNHLPPDEKSYTTGFRVVLEMK